MRTPSPTSQEANPTNFDNERAPHYLKTFLYTAIKENEEIFDFLQNNAPDGVCIIDPHTYWMNPKLLLNLGYDPGKTPAHKNWEEFMPAESVLEVKDFLSSSYNDFEREIQFYHSSGFVVWMECKIIFLNKEQNRDLALLGFTDITRFKRPDPGIQKELKRYEHIIKGTNIGTWEWNVQTGESVFNEQWANILGYTLEEIQPTSPNTWKRFAHPDDMKKCDLLFQEHFDGITDFYESESRMRNKKGEWIWILDKGKVVSWTPDGKPEWMTGFHEEITQRKQEYERNKLFIDQAPSAIAMFDRNMKYLAASQKWLNDFDIKDKEIIGSSHYDVFPNPSEEWKEIHQKCLNGQICQREEDTFIDSKGNIRWLSWEARPWYNDVHQIGGITMHTVDITRIKSAEKENTERKVLLEAILDNIEIGIIACDEVGNLTLFNKVTRKIHGVPLHHIPTSKYPEFYGLYHPDGKTLLKEDEVPILQALNHGNLHNKEILIKNSDGSSRIILVNGSQLRDKDNKIFGAVAAINDITHRKLTEEKLRISEEAFRGNFENAAVGMAILDLKGKWLEVNNNLCEMVGYTAQEFMKFTIQDLTHPDDLLADHELLQELMRGEREYYHMEKRYFHKDGHLVYVIISVSMVGNKEKRPFYFISQITDISRQKIAEQKLRETLAQLEGISNASTHVSIISTDTKGIITNFNKGAENFLEYTKEEVLLKKSLESIHVKEEIEDRSMEISAVKGIKVNGFEVFKALAKGDDFDTREWNYVKKDGTSFPVQLTLTTIKSDNEITGYLCIAADISEIKKVEDEITSLLAVTKDQNQRLKNFAHIVSHNLRSHSGNFEMLLDLYKQESPEAWDNEIIQLLGNASDNLKETVAHLNEVVLMNTSVGENLLPINLSDAVNRASKNISAIAKQEKVEIINNIDPDLKILGVSAYVDSILLNFLTNGIKYRCPDKQCHIKLYTEKEEEYTILYIEDNGLGMDLKRHGNKLFGMYKTFHNNKEARGIGLFITKNQVEAIGGKIEVISEVKKGTTFKLYLKNE